MHDGGGDRSKTVKALPQIIDGLRKRGYRFVTVPELLALKDKELNGTPVVAPAASSKLNVPPVAPQAASSKFKRSHNHVPASKRTVKQLPAPA
jgi:cAMP phosphodiesterase